MNTIAQPSPRDLRALVGRPDEVSVLSRATMFFDHKLTFHLRGRDSRAAARGRCARRFSGSR